MTHSRGTGWVERERVNPLWTKLVVLGGVVVVLLAAKLVVEGDLRAGSAFLIGGPFVLVPWWIDRGRHAPYDYEGKHGAGLALPLRATSWAIIVCLPAWAILVALVVAGVWRDGDGGVAGAIFASLVGGFLVLFLIATAVAGVVGRLMKNRMILMDVDGIFIKAPAGTARLPWHALESVRRRFVILEGKYQTKADDTVHNFIEFTVDKALVEGTLLESETHGSEDGLVFDRDQLAMDPHLAVAVIEFYLKNPEERGDLRTVVALDRVASIAKMLDPA